MQQRLSELPPETLVFLSGQVVDQAGGRAFSPVENGRLVVAISPFPIFTFWDFHLGTGVLGGRILTGPDQGRAAAKLALRILAGTPADEIPVVMTSPTSAIFDDQVRQRLGVSPADLPARYGGEELAVILPGTDAQGARLVAERIRAAIAGLAIPYPTPPRRSPTG